MKLRENIIVLRCPICKGIEVLTHPINAKLEFIVITMKVPLREWSISVYLKPKALKESMQCLV